MSRASRAVAAARALARWRVAALAAAALALGGPATCIRVFRDPGDRMLFLDPLEPTTGWVAEVVPRTPWIRPGPDGEMGTADDVFEPYPAGDDDLALRTGITAFSGPLPPPRAGGPDLPLAVAEPFAAGTPVSFVVSSVDLAGVPVVAPSIEGAPVLVVAFADLDGDGYVGITQLDGDALDAEIESAELEPVGRRVAIARAGRASGALFVAAGGPAGAPLTVVLGAAAYAGPFDPGYFQGAVPRGPAVMTRLPFFPRTDPDRVIDAGGGGLRPADPDAREAVAVEAALVPDPSDPRIGEAFTLRTDGTDTTIDAALVRSGAFARFGLGLRPDPRSYRELPSRPLRVGLDDGGAPVLYEILGRVALADDGPASQLTLRVLPLDRLGNVADPPAPSAVSLRSGGTLRIVSPDTDGDPFEEVLLVGDARGAEVVIDDPGGRFDDPSSDQLVIEGAGAILRLDASLPDPDVDDSGLVDLADLAIVEQLDGLRLGDPGFDGRYDLDLDGRIDDADAEAVADALGAAIPVP